MKKIALSALLVGLLSACSTHKPAAVEAPAEPVAAKEAPAAAAQAPAAVEYDALNDPKSVLAGRSVYYPFDVSVVQEADRPLVAAHAKYLGEHANRSTKVEGNCDERGSNEYNLALGQRRADGVKSLLVKGGAKEGQITTASYGEEKPKCADHKEACWSQNRRSDLNYGAK